MDEADTIRKFWTESEPERYHDKKVARRFSDIWLRFLDEEGVTAWASIDEPLCKKFKHWRYATALHQHRHAGKPPSALVVNRHIHYLSRGFDEAVARKLMAANPVRNWPPDPHVSPLAAALDKTELLRVLSDREFDRDWLMNGETKVPLGWRLRDLYLLLFCSCKRRGEIVRLKIAEVRFADHLVAYSETKNRSKGRQYVTHKAFALTQDMESLLRRVIGKRKEGPVFACPDVMARARADGLGHINEDYVSKLFSAVVARRVPRKKADVSLHNLRHGATDVLERAGLTDAEIDAALGHHQIRTALPHYQDRSAAAIGRRLAARTRRGVEVLSAAVKPLMVH